MFFVCLFFFHRYMMLINGKDEVFMVDRDNSVFHIANLEFPFRKDPTIHLANTLLDGVSCSHLVSENMLHANFDFLLVLLSFLPVFTWLPCFPFNFFYPLAVSERPLIRQLILHVLYHNYIYVWHDIVITSASLFGTRELWFLWDYNLSLCCNTRPTEFYWHVGAVWTMQVFCAFQHRAADRRNLILKINSWNIFLSWSNLDEFPLPIIFLKVDAWRFIWC